MHKLWGNYIDLPSSRKTVGLILGAVHALHFNTLCMLSAPGKHRQPSEIISTQRKMTLHHTVQSVV